MIMSLMQMRSLKVMIKRIMKIWTTVLYMIVPPLVMIFNLQ